MDHRGNVDLVSDWFSAVRIFAKTVEQNRRGLGPDDKYCGLVVDGHSAFGPSRRDTNGGFASSAVVADGDLCRRVVRVLDA
jgi:hypothetical protein